jgi:hypothetical protein
MWVPSRFGLHRCFRLYCFGFAHCSHATVSGRDLDTGLPRQHLASALDIDPESPRKKVQLTYQPQLRITVKRFTSNPRLCEFTLVIALEIDTISLLGHQR